MSTSVFGVITIGIDPTIELGPLTLAWHGFAIALGVLAGAWVAARYARERGLDPERVTSLVLIVALSGIVGARFFYLAVAEPGALLRPQEWVGTTGFAFYGALILAPIAVALYLRRERLTPRYLDALAAGFPLGMAVGRIGDVINGEHYGPPSDLPWAFRYTHPDADVPSTVLAYHSGGFYEVVLALGMLAVVWPLRHRLRRPLMLLWAVIALYGAGRFVMFFFRSDSEALALGLNEAQWTSLALMAAAAVGAWWSASHSDPTPSNDASRARPKTRTAG
ncbi:MAG: prolipoprotein diacylglyceryl transferase [Thermoleophilaceae bacterium]|nr:prolipoprotein diacylglyceryl transferase [Thermoleophilaceae bacterium]